MTKKLMTIAAIATLVLMLAACSATSAPKTPVTNNPTPTTQNPTPTTQNPTPTVKTFTLAQLAKYNGKNGQPAYIAVSGIVYDVTNVKSWNNGSHQGISAGLDLTKAITQVPHGTSVLTGLKVVGKLV